MKRLLLLSAFAAVLVLAASAQDMSGSDSGSNSGTGSMMAPADTMTGQPDTMKGSTMMMSSEPSTSMNGEDSMMAGSMSYEALKKAGKLADTATGMELRTARSTGMKVAYTTLPAAESLAAKSPTVLFFAADWCPSCQADLRDINANGSRLGDIHVVVVDYDHSAALKKKYGITVQDTYVQIGSMGQKIGIWNGGGVQGVLDNIHSMM